MVGSRNSRNIRNLSLEKETELRRLSVTNFSDFVKELEGEVYSQRAEIKEFEDALLSKDKQFIHGAGRSGLVGRTFAMRLMHLGLNPYIVGDTVTPSIKESDAFMVISGSGARAGLAGLAKERENPPEIFAITSFPQSALGKLADYTIVVKGRQEEDMKKDYLAAQLLGQDLGRYSPLNPMGSKFEYKAFVLCELMVADLAVKLGVTEKEMKDRHPYLEE